MTPHLTVTSKERSISDSATDLTLTAALLTTRYSMEDNNTNTNAISTSRPLIRGVYVPTLCFFDPETENLDTETIAQHTVRLAQAGVAGLATQGSNGEAVHLTHGERRLVTMTTRDALDGAGFAHVPVIVGCGAQSVRETIQFCCEAADAGGDYALVLPPSYYAALFSTSTSPSPSTIEAYFTAIADASPIPLIIYNYPAGAGGIDLSSDLILSLARHRNIVGVKLTCGNTGKLNRIAAAKKNNIDNKTDNPEFLVLAGSADFALPALIAGGHGMLAGLANLAPRACAQTVELYRAGRVAEAQGLQDVVARGDWVAIRGGVVGVKSGLQSWMGYGGVARRPLPRPTEGQTEEWMEGFRELMEIEKTLL